MRPRRKVTIAKLRSRLDPHLAVTQISVDAAGLVASLLVESGDVRRCLLRGEPYLEARYIAQERWGPTGDAAILNRGFALGVRVDAGFLPLVWDSRSWQDAAQKPFPPVTASAPTCAE